MVNLIHNIEAKDLLSKIANNSIDFILTDPPYELDNNGGSSNNDFANRKLIKEKHLTFISNGFDYDSIFSEFERVCKVTNIVVFCSNKQVSKIMSYWEQKGYSTTLLIWKKPNPIPLSNGNYISNIEFMVYVRGKNATYNNIGVKEQCKTFMYSPPSNKTRIHPTEKPIDMLRRLLLIHSNKQDVVLDCFSGSGSLAKACLLEDRNFICSEIDEVFYNGSLKLIENIKNQTNLFQTQLI